MRHVKDQTDLICLEAVRESGWSLSYVKDQSDTICVAAVKNDSIALAFVKNQTEFICLEAVKQNGNALVHVLDQTDTICLEAVRRNGEALMFVKKQTSVLCLEAVRQDGFALKYVKEQTEELCFEAVKQNGDALQYVKEQTEALCFAAVKQNGIALKYVKEQTEELCFEAVKRNGLALEYMKEQTYLLCFFAVGKDGLALEFVKNQTHELCLTAVRNDVSALKYVNPYIFQVDINEDEFKTNLKEKTDKKNITNFDSIIEKKMFYNEKEKTQIAQLIKLLSNDNFDTVQKRLKESKMRIGFNCIFSGLPGTGKTETVYQIALETKRDIMEVDISNTKSMWFGESEKKIKEVFTKYKDLVEKSERTPILLLNEADAVLGTRLEFDNASQSIDQTKNAIQNIILQELENMQGIMIATSNLVRNLDKAFERRFLYKIEFDKPNLEVRKALWQSMLPALNGYDAQQLAEKFEFSGGQMENVSRKMIVNSILSGDTLSLDGIIALCEEENFAALQTVKPIGFGEYEKSLASKQ